MATKTNSTETLDKPAYFVINPYHDEIHNAPPPFTPIKRTRWWDGTCIKVINKERSHNYWIQAWRKELTVNHDVDNRFNKKLNDIRKMCQDLSLIKRSIDRQTWRLYSY